MSESPEKDAGHVILESIADGVFTVDRQWRITLFNRAAEQITGVRREEAVGQRCCDVFRASICENECALKEAVDTGRRPRKRSSSRQAPLRSVPSLRYARRLDMGTGLM